MREIWTKINSINEPFYSLLNVCPKNTAKHEKRGENTKFPEPKVCYMIFQ